MRIRLSSAGYYIKRASDLHDLARAWSQRANDKSLSPFGRQLAEAGCRHAIATAARYEEMALDVVISGRERA